MPANHVNIEQADPVRGPQDRVLFLRPDGTLDPNLLSGVYVPLNEDGVIDPEYLILAPLPPPEGPTMLTELEDVSGTPGPNQVLYWDADTLLFSFRDEDVPEPISALAPLEYDENTHTLSAEFLVVYRKYNGSWPSRGTLPADTLVVWFSTDASAPEPSDYIPGQDTIWKPVA